MARYDHTGPRDEIGRGTRHRGAARGRDIERHEPNYGNSAERTARTHRDAGAAFQARDYERDNYGGGYGVQRRSRDVPAAGRKGEWMHDTRNPDPQASTSDLDTDYRRWREAALRAHDEDYHSWRGEQAQRYDEDYARWKAQGGKKPGPQKR